MYYGGRRLLTISVFRIYVVSYIGVQSYIKTDGYFFVRFLGDACDNALPAAIFASLPDRPSRNTFDAALAALELVRL